jgi:hypothetical protein
MPPTFWARGSQLSSPNALISDLQSANLRLRLDNQALRRHLETLSVTACEQPEQAEQLAARLRELAVEADAAAARLRRAADVPPPVEPPPVPSADSSAAAALRCDTEAPAVAVADTAAESADVLLESAARLDSVATRMVPPLRGSYLVELWKRRETTPVRRQDLPSRAFWSAAELNRLASILSDAFDERGQPAWGLLAAWKPSAKQGDAAAPPASRPPLHVFAGAPLDPAPTGGAAS